MVKIKNSFLKERIYNALRKNEDEELTINELQQIKYLKLDGKTFSNEDITYYLTDFAHLNNIQKIIFDQFFINDNLIEIINFLKSLNDVEFSHCVFQNITKIETQIKKLTFSYCEEINFNIISQSEKVESLDIYSFKENIIDLNKLLKYSNIKNLSLFNTNIINSSCLKDFINLESLNLNGSIIDCENVQNLLKNNVKFSHNKYFYSV